MLIEYETEKEHDFIINKIAEMVKNKIHFNIKPSKGFAKEFKKKKER